MNRAKPASLLAACGFLAACGPLHAGEIDQVEDLFSRCRVALGRLSYVQYTVTGESTDPGSAKLYMDWREKGKTCQYAYVARHHDGSPNFQAVYSFNGNQARGMWYGSGSYIVQHAPKPIPPWIQNLEFITAPFEFVVRQPAVDGWESPNVLLLQSPGIWCQLVKETTVLGARPYHGRDCVAIQVDHSTDRYKDSMFIGVETHYLVYLDARTSVPVAWQEYDPQNRLMAEMEVTKEQNILFENGGSYPAPKQIKETFYNREAATLFHNEVSLAWVFDFSAVSTRPETSDFTLKFVNPKSIWDEDAHHELPLP